LDHDARPGITQHPRYGLDGAQESLACLVHRFFVRDRDRDVGRI
jgi:hypothetical protein